MSNDQTNTNVNIKIESIESPAECKMEYLPIYSTMNLEAETPNFENVNIKSENISNNEELAFVDIAPFGYMRRENFQIYNVENDSEFPDFHPVQNPNQVEYNENDLAVFNLNEPVKNVMKQPIKFIQTKWDFSNSVPYLVTKMINVGVEQKSNANGDLIASSPHDSDSGLGNECGESSNLSWLLNFKLEEQLPVLHDTNTECSSPTIKYTRRKTPEIYTYSDLYKTVERIPVQYIQPQYQHQNVNAKPENFEATETPTERRVRYEGSRKPPFTYTELIEHALREKGALTVSGIYQWISEHFAYYKVNDDRWKNSVRHNLSINPHFRKGNKSVHGAGHLWTIAQKDDQKNTSAWKMKKQRMAHFMQTASDEWQLRQREQDIELANATASILPDIEYGQENQFQSAVQITQIQQHEPVQLEINNKVLNAVKPEIEIQYIIPVKNNSDFLCPVTKEEVAEECGLISDDMQTSNDYLITDFNPADLGFDLAEAEIITSDQLFSEDLCLQYSEMPMDQH